MSNGTNGVQHHELEACQNLVEHKILLVENQIKSQVTILENEVKRLIDVIETLVTKQEFFPVKVFVYGAASGMLATVLGVIMARIAGWS